MGLRPRFKTPFTEARDKLIAYAMRPLRMLQPRTRFLIGSSLLVLLTTVLLVTDDERLRQQVKQALPAASLFLAQDAVEAVRYLEQIDLDLAIWSSVARGSGQAVLQHVRHLAPDCVTLAIGVDEDGGQRVERGVRRW